VNYSRCKVCYLDFQNPMPDEEYLREFYSNGDYRKIVNHKRGVAQSVLEGQRVRAGRILPFIGQRLPAVERVLDVGSGAGVLLAGLRKAYGCAILGSEWDEDYRTYSVEKGIPTEIDIPEEPESFDLATCVHVLEHTARPVELLQKIAGCLEPGAYLYLEVPYREWDIVHTLAFDDESLKRAAMLAGIKALECSVQPSPARVILWGQK
jgi:2-polyprenyl-3-methyl-5-hydroxy-6-metoxy-1,4-benzoquinol methylase